MLVSATLPLVLYMYNFVLNRFRLLILLFFFLAGAARAAASSLPPFSILRDHWGCFHQEKIVFWLPSIIPYMARRENFPCRSCKNIETISVHNTYCVKI